MTNKRTRISDAAIKKMLKKYDCPFQLHQVRMCFVGALISPNPISPIDAVKMMWDGELPAVDDIAELNDILNSVLAEIWNPLVRKLRMERKPVTLAKPPAGKGRKALSRLVLMRAEELICFEAGLLGGYEGVDIPEQAADSMRELANLVELFASIKATLDIDVAGNDDDIRRLRASVSQLVKIAETEVNAVVDACLDDLHENMSTTVH